MTTAFGDAMALIAVTLITYSLFMSQRGFSQSIQPQAPAMNNSIGSIYGNQGIITQGQIGNNTLNIGPQTRNIDSPNAASLKQQILRELPKDKPITVMALGDAESIQFAMQIHTFMRSNNFTMKEPDGISQGVFTGVVKGLQRRDEADGSITFIVGANIP